MFSYKTSSGIQFPPLKFDPLILKKNPFSYLTIIIFVISIFVIQTSLNPYTSQQVGEQSIPLVSQSSSNLVSTPIGNDRLNLIDSVDSNNNHIADGLEEKMNILDPNSLVKVVVTLKDNIPIPEKIIRSFRSFGGMVSFQWNDLGMFAGTIPLKSIKLFAEANSDTNNSLGLIEEDKQMVKMSEQNQLTNVDPYVWNNYNLLGDSNSSIAILDTGVDATHPMLANFGNQSFSNNSVKIVGWFDGTTDNNPSPQDMDGHGSHVAAIAAGNPYNDTMGNGNIQTTYTASYNDTQSLGYQAAYSTYLNVTTPGTITQTYYWKRTGGSSSTYGSGFYLVNPQGYVVTSSCGFGCSSTGKSINANSGNYSISYAVSSNFGLYQLELAFYYQDPNSNLDMVAYGNEPYTAQLSGLHAKFSGVAPDTKIIAVKVFANNGDGPSSFLINGINWVINHKNIYHITIASMSLGFPCSPTGCKSSDIDTGVQTAVTNLVNAGIVTFVAAGNDGSAGNNQIGTPGNINSVITVGATDNYHSVTYYSSLGPGYNSASSKPDLTAPGGLSSQGAILSADSNNNDAEGNMDGIIPDFQLNDLTALQGTSMATPNAAGIGSLIIQAMGGYGHWNYSIANVYKVKQIMLMSTWATNGTDRTIKDIHEGLGEIQANAAIDVIKQSQYTIGSVANATLSNQRLSNKIWGRQVSLSAGTQYNFVMTMNSSLDSDLYIYSKDYGTYGDPVIVAESRTDGRGANEYLSFTPSASGIYYIYVKLWSGKGNFYLSSYSTSTSTSISFNSPTSGTTITSTTVVKVSVSNSAGIKQVQARFSGSMMWVNMTYNSPSKTYQFNIDPTEFPNSIYSGMDVKVLDNNLKTTYKSVYYVIATSYTASDTIQIALTSQVANQINNVYTKQFTFSYSTVSTPDSVKIYIDDLLFTSLTNSSLILSLPDGLHEIRAVAVKGSTVRSIGLTYVLIDTAPRPPTILSPLIIDYAIGTQNQINWYVSDNNPGNFTVYENSTVVATGAWQNDIPITVSLNNLTKGFYNYTLIAFDTTGLNSTNTVFVIAYHRAVITGPTTISFTEGALGQSITWNVTDDALANYTIYQNNAIVQEHSINGTNALIIYNLTGLTVGSYNYTLGVYDQDNILVSNNVAVTVLSNTLPTTLQQTTTTTASSNNSQPSKNNVNPTSTGFELIVIGGVLAVLVTLKRRKK